MRVALLLAEVLIVVSFGCHDVFGAPNIPSYVKAATSDTNRPESDTKRDEYYKPAPVIAFAGVKPDMKVADFLIWDAYYSRIFSNVVGRKGFVYTYYAAEEDGVRPRVGETVGADLSQLENVGIIHASARQFVTPEPIDMVWIGMSYHDLHNTNLFKDFDIQQINKAMFATLKPGGTLVILDRAASKGSGLSGLPLSRIDEALVKREVEGAGFKLIGESDALRDATDDHTTRVTKPQYQMRADEFLIKFRKPLR